MGRFKRFMRRCGEAFSEVGAEQILRGQLRDAEIERVRHAAIAEEHAAWVKLQDARIARVKRELKAIEQRKKEATE